MTDPTRAAYHELSDAYDFFNSRLFGSRLPRCLITMQRRRGAYGYFAGARFGTQDGAEITDEIALNPSHFARRTTEENLSTLVHEMVHLDQHHFGKPGSGSYHNRQWAEMMHAIGLIPTDTDELGGNETGHRVGHIIAAGGPFDLACAELLRHGFIVRYVELESDPEQRKKKVELRKRKAESKTKCTYEKCGLNAWGKPLNNLLCGDCSLPLTPVLKRQGQLMA